ncbi:MAG: AAA family ATPase [Phycisphaerae bacterium]|nr:AAA family ATPase [Phycisphaerae bacterium]
MDTDGTENVGGADASGTPLDTPEAVQAAAERFRQDFAALREQIGRAVVGQRQIVDSVLICLFAGGHALLEGVPGIGKTLLIRSLAQALRLEFGRIQFTPDLMPADIVGTTVVVEVEGEHGRTSREFRFQPGPVFHQMVLADEINRATPKTQSALLEAMQERAVTAQGETRRLPDPFFVMATQNPLEQEGTYPLPEAQLDRFLFKLLVGYATREDMHEILARTTSGTESQVSAVIDGARIIEHQRLVRRVVSAPHVTDYAVRLVLATHPKGRDSDGRFSTPMVNQYVRVGASPRAAQALTLGGKVLALLDGRAALSIDDVKKVALPALRHRLIMNFEAEAEGVSADDVIRNIAETLPREVGSTATASNG